MIIVHNEKVLDVIRNTYTKRSLQDVVSLLKKRNASFSSIRNKSFSSGSG